MISGGIEVNPSSANLTKWSNTLEQFIGNLATNFLGVLDHSVGLALEGLINSFKFRLILKVKLYQDPALCYHVLIISSLPRHHKSM